MSDDRTTDQSGGGFDDWLDDEPGPVTDPYKALASDADEDDDIADWMDFAGGQVDGGQGTGDETGEVDAIVAEAKEDSEPVEDVMGEVEAVAPETNEDADRAEEVTGEVAEVEHDEDDTGELEIVSDALGESSDDLVAEPDDDVAEATSDTVDVSEATFSTGTTPEVFDIAHEPYALTATREHADLAESVSLADEEDTQQVALAAPLPGLEPTVVGFEDVVEAEGYRRVRSRASGDLVARVVTGLILIAALSASLLWRPALVGFALAVFVLGAGELYTALLRTGRKPIALFGFIGIIGASLGAFFFGALAIPAAFMLTVTASLLFYAVVPAKADPIGNLALTIIVMTWAGLGSFTMLIARSDSYRILIFGVVVVVVAMDVAQYFFGRALGKHQLAPWVSPKKTIEGLVAGVVVALTVGSLLHFLQPFELTSGLLIGAVVATFAPIGDLAMSAAKRSLGLKDMGSVLPGHGGFLDRIDGLIFAIPVAWAVFLWVGIL